MSKIDLSNKVERIEAFEERLGVRIENVSVWFDDEEEDISILFEFHSASGTTISQDITVEIVAYNNRGQIIAKEEDFYFQERFWGFETCKCYLEEISPKNISKIRVYPIAG